MIQEMDEMQSECLKRDLWTRRNIFFYGSMAAALSIGVLQMNRIRGGLITDYGADLFGTVWLYAMFRQGRTIFQRGRRLSAGNAAVLVFLGCAASEFAQKLHWLPGVYDAFDILAYALAVAGCFALDGIFGSLA